MMFHVKQREDGNDLSSGMRFCMAYHTVIRKTMAAQKQERW